MASAKAGAVMLVHQTQNQRYLPEHPPSGMCHFGPPNLLCRLRCGRPHLPGHSPAFLVRLFRFLHRRQAFVYSLLLSHHRSHTHFNLHPHPAPHLIYHQRHPLIHLCTSPLWPHQASHHPPVTLAPQRLPRRARPPHLKRTVYHLPLDLRLFSHRLEHLLVHCSQLLLRHLW